MKIGHYFSPPTKNLLATLASGSVSQNWFAHLESSVSWIHNYTHNQAQCLHDLVKLKPKLCREPLYGDYLNVVTQSNSSVNEEPGTLERAKRAKRAKRTALKNRWHSPKTVAQNSPKSSSPKFQAKNFTDFSSDSSSKPKTSNLTHLPKSFKPAVPVNKLQKWTAEQNFQATLPEPKKQHQYFTIKHPKAESGSLNTKHKYSKKKSRLQFKDTINTGNNWFQDISHRVNNTLQNNKQAHGLAHLLSTDKRKYPPFNFAGNDIPYQEQTITYGKRASYELLANQSGLFEGITKVASSTTTNAVVNENRNAQQENGPSKLQTDYEKTISKEQAFYQNLKNGLKQQPIFPTQASTRVQGHQDILSDAQDLPKPVLQHDIDPKQLLDRLIATEEMSTSAPLPTQTEQQSTNGENQVTAANYQQAQLADAGLPELASRVKRILDEQARRHGIDV